VTDKCSGGTRGKRTGIKIEESHVIGREIKLIRFYRLDERGKTTVDF
jgi:hypothetical protein